MRLRQVAAVALLLGAGVVLAAAPALGMMFVQDGESVGSELAGSESADFEASGANEVNVSSTDNDFGTQVSSFAQSSAADADTSMETGLWSVAVEASTDPDEEVSARIDALFDRLDRFEERTAELEAMRENETISELVYEARANRLQAQLANTGAAINHTERIAQRVGVEVNQTTLDALRNEAATKRGPEVADRARNITDAPRGPPGDRGPPDHAGPGNGSDAGPPTDRGNGNDAGPPSDDGGGPPDDRGTGSSGNNSNTDNNSSTS